MTRMPKTYKHGGRQRTVALYRALIKKGVLAREEAVRILLDDSRRKRKRKEQG
jgi:hypothetical protein